MGTAVIVNGTTNTYASHKLSMISEKLMSSAMMISWLLAVVFALLGESSATINVTRDCPGVIADGHTDVTIGLTACIAGCIKSGCRSVLLPSGDYLISKTVSITTAGPLTIQGEGKGTVLLWAGESHLLDFQGATSRLVLASLSIVSSGDGPKSSTATAVRFDESFTQSLIDAVYVTQEGPSSDLPVAFNLGKLTDSVTLREVQVWGVSGTGVVVGKGSQVIIKGGRVIGNGGSVRGTSVGVHCTGNNGGVHVDQTDLIAHLEGLRLDNSSGAGSNREIFISQATFDSSWRGVSVYDHSYIDISGCWAASSEDANIFISPQSENCLVSITGGTIFNACAEQGGVAVNMTADRRCRGLDANAGSFTLTGVLVRNNQGLGLSTTEGMRQYTLTGNKFFGNGASVSLRGSHFVATGNVFDSNTRWPNVLNGTDPVVANNFGFP